MLKPAEFIDNRRSRRRANKVFDVLVKRAPNGMRLPHLKKQLPSMTEVDILDALNILIEKKLIKLKNIPNNQIPGRVIRIYTLTNPTQYPMSETILIGEVEFPRSFHGDMMGAEDINAFTEAIAEYDSKIEKRITRLAASMTRKYWANIAALFALFVSIFALILRASEPIPYEGIPTPELIFWLKVAELGPLTLVLFLFVVVFWLSMRKI